MMLRQSPMVRAAIQTSRGARLLTPRGRFLAGQCRRGGVGRYRLDGHTVHVRHRTRDLDIVTEVFGRGSYEPPPDCPLGGPLRVLDVGGNIGLFGVFARDRWDVIELRSYEPDPANAELLRLTAHPYDNWTVTEAAVSNEPGTMPFRTGLYSESRGARPGETAIDVPVIDLFEERAADLLKMDIEGGEWPILGDPRLSDLSARVIVMEWHQAGAPGPDASACASRLLDGAGYTVQRHLPGPTAANGLLWAWRPS